MKRTMLFVAVTSLAISLPAFAAQRVDNMDRSSLHTQYGLLENWEGDLYAGQGMKAPQAALAFLRANRSVLPGSVDKDLEVRDIDTSIPGITHVIMGQLFKGIPVYNSHLVVSVRNANAQVFRAWAKLMPVPTDLSVDPILSVEDAELRAMGIFNRADVDFQEDTELVVMRNVDDEARYHLAYRVHLYADEQASVKNRVYLIDANDGSLLSWEEKVWAGTASVGTGVGVWGETRTLQTYNTGTTYQLADASRTMYKASTNTGWIKTYSTEYSTSAPLSADTDNNWDATSQGAEVDAHHWAGVVYEYFKTTHAWNSYDNKGSDIKSYTHADMNNAYWGGSYMTYGDGDGVNFYNFAGDVSVAAHEMTHGVTQNKANLTYSYSSGALNEAFSDIMAKMEIDTDNWLIGDKIITDAFIETYGVYALRDMQDPTFGGLYDPTAPLSTMAQPDHMSVYAYLNNGIFTDYGGVHVNSGIINKMSQLMADGGTHYGVAVPALGRAVTAKIFFTVNSPSYLATTSDFDHFATKVQAATKDLYGASSAQVTGVVKALQAVGLLSIGATALAESESNNGTSSADPVSTSNTDVSGYLSSSTDKDYFKVVVPAGKKISAFLRVPYLSDFSLELYQGSKLITSSAHTGNGQDEALAATNTGTTNATCYLLVKRYAGSTGSANKYLMNVKWQ